MQHDIQPYVPNHDLRVLAGTTDHFPPDVQAMLMALYSRSYAPIESRLPTTPESEDSLRSRLRQFYVGYGHKSIGQCGHSSVWFEGVSQLAAKAIENHPLFNGQESSTRYIDFTSQDMVNFNNMTIQSWQERWRALYIKALPATIEKIKLEYPFEEPTVTLGAIGDMQVNLADKQGLHIADISQDEARVEIIKKTRTTWNNTIKARAFDICGSLLPAGVTTNVVMSTTFDTFNDHFGEMLHHPSSEMRHIAREAIRGIEKKYPDATGGVDKLFGRYAYVNSSYFYAPEDNFLIPNSGEVGPYLRKSQLQSAAIALLLDKRNRFEELPRHVQMANRYRLQGFLDFRSFRDLHRHRNGVWLMPLLTTKYGFEQWYLDNLPEDIATEVKVLAAEMQYAFSPYGGQMAVELQYAIPMGFRVPMSYDCHLGSLLYLFERRTDKTVHQTARRYMQESYRQFNNLGMPFNIHIDMDEDNFTLRRGTQTVSGEFK